MSTGKRDPRRSNAPHARRARQLRNAFGMTGPEFAERIGIGYKTWQNVESGYPLSATAARRLEEALPGMASEWITRGWTGNLSFDWAVKLGLARMMPQEAEEAEAQQPDPA